MPKILAKLMKKLFILFAVLFIYMTALIFPQTAHAEIAGTSAALTSPFLSQEQEVDNRAEILQGFLESYNSPLAPYAKVFVEEADKNNLDWKLVAAISGVESWFGQQIPTNTYNGWGYGVYGNNVRYFTSWEDGIATVSHALRTDYLDSWGATNVTEIGAIYAADPHWAFKVQHFIDLMNQYEEKQTKKTLSLSL